MKLPDVSENDNLLKVLEPHNKKRIVNLHDTVDPKQRVAKGVCMYGGSEWSNISQKAFD